MVAYKDSQEVTYCIVLMVAQYNAQGECAGVHRADDMAGSTDGS